MAYDAKAIANYFLDRAATDRRPLDPLKLQKLVYYAHGWHLAITGEPLIDERIEAWPYGPVVSSLYHEFKEFGAGAITRRATELVIDEAACGFRVTEPAIEADDSQTLALLDRVWEAYRGLSGPQLSNMTHRQGAPWDQARRTAAGVRNVQMDDEVIGEYFVRLARENAARGSQ